MNTTFSSGQLFRLFFMYSVATTNFQIQYLFQLADYEGWISILLGFILSILLAFFAVRLAKDYPNQEWGDYGKHIVGSWLHTFFIFLVISFCLLLTAVSLQQYADFFTTFYFQDTPDFVFIIILLFSVALIVSSGIKTVIHMNDILFIGLILTSLIFTVIVLTTPKFDYSMLRMIFHFDWNKINYSSLITLNWTGDIVLFLFLAPEFKTKRSPIIALILAALLTTFINLQHWVYSFLEFGYHLTQRIRFPQLEYLRFASTGDFLKNIDPFPILVLTCALLIKLCLLNYIATKLFINACKVKINKYKYFPFIFMSVCITIAIIFSYKTVLFNYFITSFYFQGLSLLIKLLPFLYFTLHKIQRIFQTT